MRRVTRKGAVKKERFPRLGNLSPVGRSVRTERKLQKLRGEPSIRFTTGRTERREADIEVHAYSQDVRSRIFIFISPCLSDHCLPISYTRNVSMILLSTYFLTVSWKDNAIIYQIVKKRVIQTPTVCWICYDCGDPVVLFDSHSQMGLYFISIQFWHCTNLWV